MLEFQSGNLAFLIIATGQGGVEAKKEVAVPLSIFAYDRESKTLLLSMSKEQLASAPAFNESELTDPGYAMKIYGYYAERRLTMGAGLLGAQGRALGGSRLYPISLRWYRLLQGISPKYTVFCQ